MGLVMDRYEGDDTALERFLERITYYICGGVVAALMVYLVGITIVGVFS